MDKAPKGQSFYFSAHPDDWIFFRGEWAAMDLQQAYMSLILVTAGDAARPSFYWNAREQGVLAAIQAQGQQLVNQGTVTLRGEVDHSVYRYEFSSGSLYCMRLPDRPNDCNLYGFMTGRCQHLTTMDELTTYVSWADLCSTMRAIVATEHAGVQATPWINAPLYVSGGARNGPIIDHEDHTCTGLAVRTFAHGLANRAWWWGYSIEGREDFVLNSRFLQYKEGLFIPYLNAALDYIREHGEGDFDEANADKLYSVWHDQEWKAYGDKSYSEFRDFNETDN